MIHSMTGFGRKELTIDDSVVSVEIKTLNSKFFDAHFKLPSELKFKEIEIRQLLSKELVRGKIECSVHLGGLGSTNAGQLNRTVLRAYLHQLKDYFDEHAILVEDKDIVPHLIRLPEVFGGDDEFWSEHWGEILEGIRDAAHKANEFRLKEGKVTSDDMEARVSNIIDLMNQIEPHEQDRVDRLRNKLKEQIEQISPENKDRFEQEMIYYLERLDISEEKTRLQAHCDHFLEVLKDKQLSTGKRLNFVSQEMGREINTLGSKANHAQIQRLVILMKDELEKVKEQVLNIL
jgi:uncharacterized protein (TIGR00255 family)